jgi:hypothetical protein
MSQQQRRLEETLAVIAEAGGVVGKIVRGKHCKIFWTCRDKKFIYVIPGTSASVRGTWNTASEIRRYARSA